MNGNNLSSSSSVALVLAAQSPAAAGEVLSNSFELSGVSGLRFVGRLATADPGNFVTFQQRRGAGPWVDTAAVLTPSADGVVFDLDIYRPTGHEGRIKIDRAVATEVGDVFVTLYAHPRRRPIGVEAGVEQLLFASPSEVP